MNPKKKKFTVGQEVYYVNYEKVPDKSYLYRISEVNKYGYSIQLIKMGAAALASGVAMGSIYTSISPENLVEAAPRGHILTTIFK